MDEGQEIDYGTLFGVELPAEDAGAGGTAETGSAPDAESTAGADAGAETQETEPQDTETEGAAADKAGTDDSRKDEKPEQTPEQRQKNAAERRRREAAAAIAKARAEEQKKNTDAMNARIAAMGVTDPYTKKPITTLEEFEAYSKALQEDRRQKITKKAGLTEQGYQDFVNNLPEVQQAKAEAAAARADAEKYRQQQAEQKVNAQIAEITKLDPEIKSLFDLTKMDNYQEFYARVKQGMTLTDAYKLTNYDRLMAAGQQAAQQKARNQTAGKSHMKQTGSRGAGAYSVPADVAAEYRAFMPGISEEEIQKHYNRYKGNQR